MTHSEQKDFFVQKWGQSHFGVVYIFLYSEVCTSKRNNLGGKWVNSGKNGEKLNKQLAAMFWLN